MPSSLGNYFGNNALKDYFYSKPVYVALHLVDPTPNSDLSSELSGGGYARQLLAFGQLPASKTITNTGSATFSALVPATITYLGFWTSKSAGAIMACCQLAPPIGVLASSQVLIAPGDVSLGL